MNTRKPGTSTVDGPNFGDLLIRESSEDSVRDSGARTCANLQGSKSHFGNFGRRHSRITEEAKSKL
jgi:hypothetical protein